MKATFTIEATTDAEVARVATLIYNVTLAGSAAPAPAPASPVAAKPAAPKPAAAKPAAAPKPTPLPVEELPPVDDAGDVDLLDELAAAEAPTPAAPKAKPAAAPKAKPAAKPAAAAPVAAVTLDAIKEAAKAFVEASSIDALKEVFDNFGHTKLSEFAVDEYPALLAALAVGG